MTMKNLPLLRADERRTTRKSKEDFDMEFGFLEASSELFLKSFKVLSNEHYKKLARALMRPIEYSSEKASKDRLASIRGAKQRT